MSDLISRHAAIDAVTDVLKRIPTNAIRAKNVLEALPSAQPEHKRGKWELIRIETDGNGLYECSVCRKGDTHAPEVEVPYCWNCGARMEGES